MSRTKPNDLLRTRIQSKSLFRAQAQRAGDDIKIQLSAGSRTRFTTGTIEARAFAHALLKASRKLRDAAFAGALQASAVEILEAVRIAERG